MYTVEERRHKSMLVYLFADTIIQYLIHHSYLHKQSACTLLLNKIICTGFIFESAEYGILENQFYQSVLNYSDLL